ncbi:MAG: DNA polymerase III subunit beta [Duodenibacillus sp.]|nr:DNA polymerase III subunit beta [Duodenibacillus sp.]
MQFIKCTREALLKPLQTVGGIVEGRQTLPILANILLSKNGDNVCFTTTDLEIQIKTNANVGMGAEALRTTLPAAKLIALLNAIPGSGTEVSLEKEDKRVVLRANSSRFSLAQLDANEYPELTRSDFATEITIPSSTLKHLMQMVHFAMAQQDIRFYLNGLLLVAGDGFIRAVATDGHRLACCDAECDMHFSETIEAILPRKTVLQLMKLLPDSDDPVKIRLGASQACFEFGDIEFLTKLIDGKFPDYTRVIPTGNDKIFSINREQLIGALKRAAILANEKFKGLRWVVTPGKLLIQSANSEMEEAVEDIAISYQGAELDLGFNVTYLLDVLSNLKNAEVRFAFSTAQGPTLLTMPDSERFRYVLMPMRI